MKGFLHSNHRQNNNWQLATKRHLGWLDGHARNTWNRVSSVKWGWKNDISALIEELWEDSRKLNFVSRSFKLFKPVMFVIKLPLHVTVYEM